MWQTDEHTLFVPKDWSLFDVYRYASEIGFGSYIIYRHEDSDTPTQAAWTLRTSYHVGIDTAIGPDSTVTWEPFDA